MLAAEKGYVEIVETLLQHDASPNIKEVHLNDIISMF